MKPEQWVVLFLVGPFFLIFYAGAIWFCAFVAHKIIEIFRCRCWRFW